MAIKITDNLMNRPLTPGGQSDGTDAVTRQFGNQTEQFSKLPNAPEGWGGVANRYAGAENRATAQAVQTTTLFDKSAECLVVTAVPYCSANSY